MRYEKFFTIRETIRKASGDKPVRSARNKKSDRRSPALRFFLSALAFLITILRTGESSSCVPFYACTKSLLCFRISLPLFGRCNNACLPRWGSCRDTSATGDPLWCTHRNNVPVSFIIVPLLFQSFHDLFLLFLFHAEVVFENIPAIVLASGVEEHHLGDVHPVRFRNARELLRYYYRGKSYVPSVEGQLDQLAGPIFHRL